jgi:hypothetical protein
MNLLASASSGSAGDGESAAGPPECGHIQAALGRVRQAAASPGEAQVGESHQLPSAPALQVRTTYSPAIIDVQLRLFR